jgi:outer membrane protein insertion porin family
MSYYKNILKKRFFHTLAIFLIFSTGTSYPQTTRVDDIDITGNDHFTYSDLVLSMVTKKGALFSPEQFSTDLMTIRSRYKNDGYLFVKFSNSGLSYNEDSSLVDITISIDEGQVVTVGKIDINGNTELKDAQILSALNIGNGDVLNDKVLESDLSDILKLYESAGLPFAKIKIGTVELYDDLGQKKIRLELNIDENSRIKIDQVKIVGNESTHDDVILRELKLSEGGTINSETLGGIKERLERLNIFETVGIPKIYNLKNAEQSGLLIEVKEGNTNTFDGVIGYSPPTATESGYISGVAFISLRNLFGTGRKLEARYLQEKKQTQELEFKYLEPYPFSLPLNINFGFLQRIQDTSYTKRNLDLKFDILLTDKITASAIGSYERVIPSDNPFRTVVVADSRTLTSGVELKYDSRDNIFVPLSGILYRSIYSIGQRDVFNFSALASQGYPKNYSIQRYFINLDVFTSFFKRQSLLTSINGGEIVSDKVEESDLFRIGGNKYVRGYRVAQILAGGLATGTLELRYAISKKGFFFGFFDGGYFYRPEDIPNNIQRQDGFIYGYGLGLRLETSLGLVSVGYALNKESTILDGVISFGLVNDF